MNNTVYNDVLTLIERGSYAEALRKNRLTYSGYIEYLRNIYFILICDCCAAQDTVIKDIENKIILMTGYYY